MKADLTEIKMALPFISPMYEKMVFGCEIDDSGTIEASVKLNDFTKNHIDSVHAVYQFSLAEAIGGAVSFAYLSFQEYVPVVKSVAIDYVASAKSDLTAYAKLEENEVKEMIAGLEKDGKHEYKVNFVLKNSDGEIVSQGVGEYVVFKRR